jgi:hypothetical protein
MPADIHGQRLPCGCGGTAVQYHRGGSYDDVTVTVVEYGSYWSERLGVLAAWQPPSPIGKSFDQHQVDLYAIEAMVINCQSIREQLSVAIRAQGETQKDAEARVMVELRKSIPLVALHNTANALKHFGLDRPGLLGWTDPDVRRGVSGDGQTYVFTAEFREVPGPFDVVQLIHAAPAEWEAVDATLRTP